MTLYQTNYDTMELKAKIQKKSYDPPKNVREETALGHLEIDGQDQATLPDDLLFRIFIVLPIEVIVRLQFVCKRWFNVINSSIFVRCLAEQSDTVLICQDLTLTPSQPTCDEFGRRLWIHEIKNWKRFFHFLDFNRRRSDSIESSLFELVHVRASYDGLVLATVEKKMNLVLMNPITRKHIELPSPVDDKFSVGSYGVSYDNEAKTYKVVHLFIEESGYNGAEILSVDTRKWRRIDGPALLIDTNEIPVSLGGSLHWLCWKRGCDCFISIDVRDEKFVSRKLPASRADRDRLLEMGGNLGFVTHVQNEMQVWISSMTDGGLSEKWIKKYSIDLGDKAMYCIPICSSRNGRELVFETRKHKFYVKNFDNGNMKRIYSRRVERMDKLYIPHRHTLASLGR